MWSAQRSHERARAWVAAVLAACAVGWLMTALPVGAQTLPLRTAPVQDELRLDPGADAVVDLEVLLDATGERGVAVPTPAPGPADAACADDAIAPPPGVDCV